MAWKCARQFMKFQLYDETNKEVKKNEMILNQFLAGPATIARTLKLHTSFSRVTILQVRVEIKNFLTGAVAKHWFSAGDMVGGAQPRVGIRPV
jgi:hypothetical protein